MINKKRIILTLLVTVTLSGLVFTGCSSTQTATNTSSQSTSQTSAATDTATFGKVTAVNGSTVTLALGTMNQGGGGGTPPDQSQTKTENGSSTTPPDKPTGSTDTAPTDGGQGTISDMLTLTGKTTTVTLSDAITLTKMSSQKPDQNTSGSSAAAPTGSTATASDITVGSILKITYKTNSTEIASIEIMTVPQASGSTTSTTV